MGFVLGEHRQIMDELYDRLNQLLALTEESRDNLRRLGATYARTDEQSAAELDASYPPSRRPITYEG